MRRTASPGGHSFRCAGIVAGLVLVAGAGDAPAQYLDTVEVQLIEVEAIVTDAGGERVYGLGAEDFELVVNGKPREISHFTGPVEMPAVDGVQSPAGRQATPVPQEKPRIVGIFIDRLSMPAGERDRLFDGLDEFLGSTLRDGDRLVIAWWRGGFPVVESNGYSDQARQMLGLIRKGSGFDPLGRAEEAALAQELSFLSTRQAELERFLGEGGSWFDTGGQDEFSRMAHEMSVRRQVMRKLDVIESFIELLSGAEGRKVAVVVANRLPLRTDYSLREPPMLKVRQRFDEVVRQANAGGVTLNAFWVARNNPADCVSAEMATTAVAANSSAADCAGSLDVRRLIEAEGLETIAERTGGVIGTGVGMTVESLDGIREDASDYYVIAFHARAKESTFEVQLRPRDRSHRVRSRSFVVERTWIEQMEARNRMNLVIAERGDFSVASGFGEWRKTRRNRFERDVVLRIPTSALTSLRGRGGSTVSLRFIVSARDGEGAIETNVVDARLPLTAEQLQSIPFIEYELTVLGDRTPRIVSIAVVDEATRHVGFTTFPLEHPDAAGR